MRESDGVASSPIMVASSTMRDTTSFASIWRGCLLGRPGNDSRRLGVCDNLSFGDVNGGGTLGLGLRACGDVTTPLRADMRATRVSMQTTLHRQGWLYSSKRTEDTLYPWYMS